MYVCTSMSCTYVALTRGRKYTHVRPRRQLTSYATRTPFPQSGGEEIRQLSWENSVNRNHPLPAYGTLLTDAQNVLLLALFSNNQWKCKDDRKRSRQGAFSRRKLRLPLSGQGNARTNCWKLFNAKVQLLSKY